MFGGSYYRFFTFSLFLLGCNKLKIDPRNEMRQIITSALFLKKLDCGVK